jgi:hypothetical protein
MKPFAVKKPGTARFVLSWGIVNTMEIPEKGDCKDCEQCGRDYGHGYEYFAIWLRHYERRTYWIRGPMTKAACDS